MTDQSRPHQTSSMAWPSDQMSANELLRDRQCLLQNQLGHFSRYGFNQANLEELRESLLEHAQIWPVATMVATEFGTKYIVTVGLSTPSGRQPLPVITVIWQQDTGEDGVRFITAYPG